MSEKPRSKTRTVAKVAVFSLFGLAVVSALSGDPSAKAPAAATPQEALAPLQVADTPQAAAAPLPFPLPSDQIAFQGVIEAARQAYHAAQNDLARGGERPKRGKAICATVTSRNVQDWVGTVYDLTSNNEGRGVLSVQLDGDIWLSTWNNALSDSGSNTLIDPQSALFAAVSTLSEGQRVVLSGSFFTDLTNSDCFDEQSLTMDGAMTEPEFTFAFSDVRPAP